MSEKLPFFALSAASAVVTYWAQAEGGAVSPLPLTHRVANAAVSFARCIGKAAWPTDLALVYPNHPWMWAPWQILAACALLLAISALVLRHAGQRRYLAVGWFWFLGPLVPVIGLVQVGGQAMADRYLYVPMTGLLIMLAWSGQALARRAPSARRWLVLGAAAAVAGCMVASSSQLTVWREDETLLQHTLAVTERNSVAHNTLGNVLHQSGRRREAIAHYRAALEIDPGYAICHTNLATALVEEDDVAAGITHLESAVAANPSYATAHFNLGRLLSRQGQLEAAERHLRRACELDPNDSEALFALAQTLRAQGHEAEAQRVFERASRLSQRAN